MIKKTFICFINFINIYVVSKQVKVIYADDLLTLFSFRQVVAWHRPFCIDLQEHTFKLLCNFLERYCDEFSSDTPPAPFLTDQ